MASSAHEDTLGAADPTDGKDISRRSYDVRTLKRNGVALNHSAASGSEAEDDGGDRAANNSNHTARPYDHLSVLATAGEMEVARSPVHERVKLLHKKHGDVTNALGAPLPSPGRFTSWNTMDEGSAAHALQMLESKSASSPVPHSDREDLRDEHVNGTGARTCNCKSTGCLKRYCDCFKAGVFCLDCSCVNCLNNPEHARDRERAVRMTLGRDPNAFRSKIVQSPLSASQGKHNRGCHCKKSACLKGYCECFQAQVLCTELCKCAGCKNYEHSSELRTVRAVQNSAGGGGVGGGVGSGSHEYDEGGDADVSYPLRVDDAGRAPRSPPSKRQRSEGAVARSMRPSSVSSAAAAAMDVLSVGHGASDSLDGRMTPASVRARLANGVAASDELDDEDQHERHAGHAEADEAGGEGLDAARSDGGGGGAADNGAVLRLLEGADVHSNEAMATLQEQLHRLVRVAEDEYRRQISKQAQRDGDARRRSGGAGAEEESKDSEMEALMCEEGDVDGAHSAAEDEVGGSTVVRAVENAVMEECAAMLEGYRWQLGRRLDSADINVPILR